MTPVLHQAAVLPWADHLDALEEWLRRSRVLLATDGRLEDLPAPSCVPDGPLPQDLALRAAVALQTLEELEQAGARRLRELQRGQAYARN
ncbi:MAG: hypothetical protein JWN17_323 [Frankiales bacterium]|nr:hypothetical protein [Frankiales bacterium]